VQNIDLIIDSGQRLVVEDKDDIIELGTNG